MAEEIIGIIGGTGLGDALVEQITDAQSHDIDTPFGKPSTTIMVGLLGKNKIAFLNRHGKTMAGSCLLVWRGRSQGGVKGQVVMHAL